MIHWTYRNETKVRKAKTEANLLKNIARASKYPLRYLEARSGMVYYDDGFTRFFVATYEVIND